MTTDANRTMPELGRALLAQLIFLDSDRAIPLLGPSRPLADPLRRGDGRVAPLLRDELRYSTPDLLAIEQHIVDVAVDRARFGVGGRTPTGSRLPSPGGLSSPPSRWR